MEIVCPNPNVAKWLVNWAASVPKDFWPEKVKRVIESCPEIRRALVEKGALPEEEEAR